MHGPTMRMPRAPRRLFAFFRLVVFFVATWGLMQRLAPASESSVMVPCPGARNVHSGSRDGTEQLTYHVDARFPAEGIISWISQQMKNGGWRPLDRDFLNPGSSWPQMREWQEFLASPTNRKSCVHQWLGDWIDGRGNIVRYALRYQEPGCDTSHLKDLEVAVVYLPADVAKKAVRNVEQFRMKRHEK
jgi:hypothetical protein